MNKKNIFIGVAWPYVNGELHVGHLAGYLLPADIYARFHRYIGNNVLMASGSDCYGTPIIVEAEQKGLSCQQVVDLYHPKCKSLFGLYNLVFDIYTKTTTENHIKVVQDMFVKWAENGYIFKKKSLECFSPEENRFLPDRYVEGTCPYCKFPNARGDQCDKCNKVLKQGELINPKSKLAGRPVILKETEHYYLDLPKLEPFLKKYVKENGPNWRNWAHKETLGWLKKGLESRCITRDLDWGVKIPVESLPAELQIENADKKRIYVWFEAVIGYLSASIEWAKNTDKWKDFWYPKEPTSHYYFMGKDNLFFHTLLWPGQLHGAFEDIHLPDYLVINHFLNLEGHKFSKSRNIIVDSKYIGEEYGIDPVRFYITSIMPENSDANFSWSDFVDVNNNILIGTLANFINRTLKLCTSLDNFLAKEIDNKVAEQIKNLLEKARNHILNCEFKLYIQTIIDIAIFGNKYIDKYAPWKLEQDSKEFRVVMTNALFIVLAIHLAWEPLIPQTNKKLGEILNIRIAAWPEKQIIQYLKDFLPKVKIQNLKPLFKKIDTVVVEAEMAKLNIKS